LTSAATSVVVIRAFTILPQPPVLRQRRDLGGALASFLPPLRRLPSSLLVGSSRARLWLRPPTHLNLEWRRTPPPQGRDGPVRCPWIAYPLAFTSKALFVTEVGRRLRIRYTGPILSF